MNFSVNIDRIMRYITAVTGGNRTCNRPSYSAADAAARAYFLTIFESLGMPVRVDGAGNIRAALKGYEPGLAPVLVGSHIDTVKNGGRFDGLLGTVCALECLRVFRESNLLPRRTVEAVIFAEEEGTNFGVTLLGSKLLTGQLSPDDLKGMRNDAGESADAVIRRAGFDPGRFEGGLSAESSESANTLIRQAGLSAEGYENTDPMALWAELSGEGEALDAMTLLAKLSAEIDEPLILPWNGEPPRQDGGGEILRPGDVHAMVEMHIEQGAFLDNYGVPVGIVERIAGMETYRVVFRGASGHAGTTLMKDRRDPMIGAAEVILGLKNAAETAGTGAAVATVGKINASPGAGNVIAGEVEFLADIRDADDASASRLSEALHSLVENSARRHGLTAELHCIAKSPSVTLDPGVVDLIDRSAFSLGIPRIRMNSGAVHDAVMMAGVTRAGMIFVPSVGGTSHCKEEETRAQDIEAGANVLLETVFRLSGEGPE